jgi:hypothetical protein
MADDSSTGIARGLSRVFVSSLDANFLSGFPGLAILKTMMLWR